MDLEDYLDRLESKDEKVNEEVKDVEKRLEENGNCKKNKRKDREVKEELDSNGGKMRESKEKIAEAGQVVDVGGGS
ncbi:peptidoglycan bridge formation glycyltransferase FemA/FemB family protein, partial [Staphylococcus epidermidis]|uniref:peptidoglycan bridge formation glycyltransferase FemA/FemB family protein n=1 Tax=Staphylococcus epidermidis TaxID=1282 RepID=UPI0011A27FBB